MFWEVGPVYWTLCLSRSATFLSPFSLSLSCCPHFTLSLPCLLSATFTNLLERSFSLILCIMTAVLGFSTVPVSLCGSSLWPLSQLLTSWSLESNDKILHNKEKTKLEFFPVAPNVHFPRATFEAHPETQLPDFQCRKFAPSYHSESGFISILVNLSLQSLQVHASYPYLKGDTIYKNSL